MDGEPERYTEGQPVRAVLGMRCGGLPDQEVVVLGLWRERARRTSRAWAMLVALAGTGCGDDSSPPADGGGTDAAQGDAGLDTDSGGPDGAPGDDGSTDAASADAGDGGSEVAVLRRASKSSTIAITGDDAIVAMVNPEDGTLSTFTTADDSRLARVATGAEPSAVVIHPDDRTAFVANRAEGTVVRVRGIHQSAPTVSDPLDVGSEPTGLALSPTGARLFVAEWAEGSVAVVDTESMTVTDRISARNPYALAITNDADTEDADELLVVPEYFGRPIGHEGTDASRQGRVRLFALSDMGELDPILLEPTDSGFAPEGGETVQASANQLGAVTVQDRSIYVPSISVSPGPPVRFNLNVQPIVWVGDLDSQQEDRSGVGTANLAQLVRDASDGDPPLFLADIVDVAFVEGSGIAYVLSRGADVVQRVVYDDAEGIQVGSMFNLQIDVGSAPDGAPSGCHVPTGIVTAHAGPRAYLNCWSSRNLGVVDLSTQSLRTTVESSSPPVGDEEVSVARGKRFFFTGRARWSNNGWSSCGSCHPGGLSDNVTWAFAAGPRQTTPLDGSFSHGDGEQKQRVFNWTGVFDEVHDFERNTRGVSGGLGALTVAEGSECSQGEVRDPEALPGNLAQPLKELQDRAENCTRAWEDVEAYIRSIRPAQGKRLADAAAVTRGAELFGMPTASANNGGCVACHGGPGWTVSRRFWTPSGTTNAQLMSESFTAPDAWPSSWSFHELQIAPQPASADSTGEAAGPAQVACVLRNVGTFGVPGEETATEGLELRANGGRAQGAGGYNVPALYSLAVTAPYLHHGQAGTLEELFDDPKWRDHLQAANAVFVPNEQQKQDLIEFLKSIDAATEERAMPVAMEGCPDSFP